jgi:hypothetical protein
MHLSFSTPLAILTAIAHLAPLARAADVGSQINFYTDKPSTDGGCSAFVGSKVLTVEETGARVTGGSDGECVQLNMPSDSESINTVYMGTGTADKGFCIFYDSFTCSGNSVYSYYSAGDGECRYARSVDGWLWKSAVCVATP